MQVDAEGWEWSSVRRVIFLSVHVVSPIRAGVSQAAVMLR